MQSGATTAMAQYDIVQKWKIHDIGQDTISSQKYPIIIGYDWIIYALISGKLFEKHW